MVDTAGSGFLQGYTQTALALHKYQGERAREDQELQLKKEDLALRRDVLKGQEASRQLQDTMHTLSIRKLLEDYGRQRDATQLLSDAETDPGTPAAAPSPPAIGGPVGGPEPTASGPSPGLTGGPPSQPGNAARMYHRLIAELGTSEGVAPQVIQHAQALIQPESNYDPDAESPKGAVGLMQLMPATATRYGVADRLNPLQNIRGGLRYVRDLYQRYPGRPDLVSAAYNAGEGAVEQAGTAVPNYPETQAYVKKVQGNLQAQAAPDVSQQVAGPGAPAASPLLRDPGVTLSPVQQQEWAALTTRLEQLQQHRATLDTRQQYLDTLAQRSAGLAQTPAFEKEAQRLQQAYARNHQETQTLLQQRQQLIEPALRIETSRVQGETGAKIAADKAEQTQKGELKAKQEFKEGQTLLDVDRQTSRQYFDTQSGQPLPQSSRYSEVQTRLGQGQVVFLDDQEAKDYRGIQRMMPLLQRMRAQLEAVYGPEGIFAHLKPEERATAAVKGGWARLTQSNPKLAEADRTLKGNVDNLRRALNGQVGTQTEGDTKRGREALQKLDGIPDSQEVAYAMYNNLLDSVNGMLGTYLGNYEYQHQGLTPLQAATKAPGRSPTGSPLLDKHYTPPDRGPGPAPGGR